MYSLYCGSNVNKNKFCYIEWLQILKYTLVKIVIELDFENWPNSISNIKYFFNLASRLLYTNYYIKKQ